MIINKIFFKMAVIRPSQESPTIPVPIIAGWLICMIVAVMGIKLKWFKANISINDVPVSQTATTGVYRAAFDPESFVPSTSTSQSYSSNIKPKKPTSHKSYSGFSLFSKSAAKLNINTGNTKSNNVVTKSSSPSSKYVPKDVTVDNQKAIRTQTTVSINNEQNQRLGSTSTSSDIILKKEQIRNNLDKNKIQIHKPQITENLSQNKINISKAKSAESIPKISQPREQILTKTTTTDSNKKQNVTTVSSVKTQETNRKIEDNVVKRNIPSVKNEKAQEKNRKVKDKEKQIKKDKEEKKKKDKKKDKFKNPDVTYKKGTTAKNEPTVNKTATILRNPMLLNSQNIKNPMNENISRGARNPLAYGPGMSPLLQRDDDQFDAQNPMLTKSSNQGVSFGGRESIVGYSDTAASIFMTSNPKPILKQSVPPKKTVSMPSIASGNIPLGDTDSMGSQTSA